MNLPLRESAARFVEVALRIRPGEGRRTALLFLHLFLAAAVFFLGRTVRDTLFLSRFPLTALPWMFVIYGGASAVVAVAYSRLADRIPRHRMILLSCAVGAVTYVGAWAGVRADARWIYPTFYVWTEVVSNLFIVQFWTVAADLLDARAAKRLFGTIGSARLLASVIVGLATGAVVRVIGTPQLIFILVALMSAIAAITLVIARQSPAERGTRPGQRPKRRAGKAPSALNDPYVRFLAIVLLLAFTAVNIGDYQFKAIARATYREDQLARFFSLFYAASGIVAFAFQLLVTPRLIARAGVGWGLTVMPGAFGLTSAALLAWPRLAVASLMKFSDNGFQYTIQETSFQALYVPFPAETKAKTRALLDAVVKPLGYTLAGFAVILFASRLAAHPQNFAFITLPLVVLWLGLIPSVRRQYVKGLESTLSARGAFALDEEFVLDSAGRQILLGALAEGSPRTVLVALEQLAGEKSEEVTRAVEVLAAHPDPTVREAALQHLAGCETGNPDAARRALQDSVADVRAAAAGAFAALTRDECVDELAPLLNDPDPKARASALGGLLRHGGVEGGIVGGGELGRLLASGDREDLVSASRALRNLGPGAFRPLRRLLASSDAKVRRAALKAAISDADPRLVPTLIGLLSDPACRKRASQALVAIGEPAVTPVGSLMNDPATSRAVRLEVPRLLRRIAQPSTYELLRSHLHAEDSRLRLRVTAALSHLRRELRRQPEPLSAILVLVTEEIADARRIRAGWTVARPMFESPLLEELFAVRAERVMRRILRLLELRFDAEALALVREHLGDPAHRANALETLDALLDAPLRPIVMPFADEGALASARAAAPPDPVAFVVRHARHPNPYVALLALDALARHGDAAAIEEAMKLVDHADPLVREGVVIALAAGDPTYATPLLAALAEDPDRTVARLAARALARLEGRPTPEEPMYSTVEKILHLKTAPVFERVAGEDLAPLARVAEVEVYAPGGAIVKEGDTGDALFIIVRGHARVEFKGRAIAQLGPGDTVGEMAVLDSEPRSATVTAIEDVEVLRIDSDAFYEILHEQVEIAEGVIRMLCQRLRTHDADLAGAAT